MSSSCSGNKWIDVTCTNLHNQVIHNAHKFATRLGSDDVVSVLFRSPFCFQGHNCLPPFLKPSPFPTWPYPIRPRLSVSLFLTKSHQASLSPCDLEIFANDNPKSHSGVFHQQGISFFCPWSAEPCLIWRFGVFLATYLLVAAYFTQFLRFFS